MGEIDRERERQREREREREMTKKERERGKERGERESESERAVCLFACSFACQIYVGLMHEHILHLYRHFFCVCAYYRYNQIHKFPVHRQKSAAG